MQMIDSSVDHSICSQSFNNEVGVDRSMVDTSYQYQEEDSYINPANVSKINLSGVFGASGGQ